MLFQLLIIIYKLNMFCTFLQYLHFLIIIIRLDHNMIMFVYRLIFT
jgi:hypothetical protein